MIIETKVIHRVTKARKIFLVASLTAARDYMKANQGDTYRPYQNILDDLENIHEGDASTLTLISGHIECMIHALRRFTPECEERQVLLDRLQLTRDQFREKYKDMIA